MKRIRAVAVVVVVVAAVVLLAAPVGAASEEAAPEAPAREAGAEEAEAEGVAAEQAADEPLNGFELSRLRVDRDRIVAGGPDRDGIRSVDQPGFAAPAEATWVRPENTVLGLEMESEARAYPVHLIERHQIVNDVVAGVPMAVTYDPLAGTPIAYERKVGERTLEFGVSGLIYNSNFLLYDRETESLWSQMLGEAIAGPLAGTKLRRRRLVQVDLASWLVQHPDSRILRRPLPRGIDYRYSPFEAYWVQNDVPFPVAARDPRFHAKELVLGLEADGAEPRAYLGSILTAQGGRIEDTFAGEKVRIDYSTELGVFRYEVPESIVATEAYWFAWKAFHPDTEIWND